MLRKIPDLLAVVRKKRDASTHGDFREVIFVVVQYMTHGGRDRFIDYELSGPSLKDIPTVDAHSYGRCDKTDAVDRKFRGLDETLVQSSVANPAEFD